MPSRLRLASDSETKFKILSLVLATLLMLLVLGLVFVYFQWKETIEENHSLELYREGYRELEEVINQRTPLAREKLADLIIINNKVKEIAMDIYSGNFQNDGYALTQWVHINIRYANDTPYPRIFAGNVSFVNDMWQSSIETLQLKQGDCEDLAILLAAFIKSLYPNSEVYVIVVSSSSSFGHAATLAFYSGEYYLFDPTFGSVFELEDGLYEWFNDIGAPQNAYVSMIVGLNSDNEKVYLDFSSTYQFVLWFRDHKTAE